MGDTKGRLRRMRVVMTCIHNSKWSQKRFIKVF